jgi:hypothetical protein
MVETPGHRRVARLSVPRRLSDPGLEIRLVRVVDLSPEGARIEHGEPLNEGLACFVDLPPDLGRIRLTGRVVWTRLHKAEQTLEGERHVYYQSGLAWTTLTSEQRSGLAAALEKLRAATEPPRGPSA